MLWTQIPQEGSKWYLSHREWGGQTEDEDVDHREHACAQRSQAKHLFRCPVERVPLCRLDVTDVYRVGHAASYQCCPLLLVLSFSVTIDCRWSRTTAVLFNCLAV